MGESVAYRTAQRPVTTFDLRTALLTSGAMEVRAASVPSSSTVSGSVKADGGCALLEKHRGDHLSPARNVAALPVPPG